MSRTGARMLSVASLRYQSEAPLADYAPPALTRETAGSHYQRKLTNVIVSELTS